MSRVPENVSLRVAIAAWVIAGALLLFTLYFHLLAALLAGLLVYELVHVIAPRLRLVQARKIAAVGLLATVIVLVFVAILFGLIAFFRSDAGSIPTLLQKMADILESSRSKLPEWVLDSLPADAEGIKTLATDWLREHSKELRTMGGEAGRLVAHMLIGMVIGAMVSLHDVRPEAKGGPFARALGERVARLGDAFRSVVFAQVRIAGINTAFTAIYLVGVLPLMGIHLPFAKTMVVITFLTGLIPVVGNLISNTVIVIVSLSVSLGVALGSLGFLVVIHKLEYFLNARIIGAHIRASAWELLVAMLAMEAAFGLPGLVAAPVYYAFLKDELSARGMV